MADLSIRLTDCELELEIDDDKLKKAIRELPIGLHVSGHLKLRVVPGPAIDKIINLYPVEGEIKGVTNAGYNTNYGTHSTPSRIEISDRRPPQRNFHLYFTPQNL